MCSLLSILVCILQTFGDYYRDKEISTVVQNNTEHGYLKYTKFVLSLVLKHSVKMHFLFKVIKLSNQICPNVSKLPKKASKGITPLKRNGNEDNKYKFISIYAKIILLAETQILFTFHDGKQCKPCHLHFQQQNCSHLQPKMTCW